MQSSGNVKSEVGKLCSKASLIPAYVRFLNFTNCYTRIYWLDYEGNKKLYNTIGPDDFLDVNTFVTHLWIFVNNETGDRLLGNWNYVYHPRSLEIENELTKNIEPRFQGTEIAIRRIVPITYPLYSLQMRALQTVRDFITRMEDANSLKLPLSLKEDLQVLLLNKNCCSNHKPSCNQCLK